MTHTAEKLGISRQKAYRLMDKAERKSKSVAVARTDRHESDKSN